MLADVETRKGVHFAPYISHLSDYLVCVNVQCEDGTIAARKAFDILRQDLDMLRFFGIAAPSDRGGAALVEIGRSRPYVWVAYPKKQFHPSGGGDPRLQQLLAIIDDLSPDDQGRFRSAVQYTDLGYAAHSETVRFVNKWVALESFIRLGDSAIEDVKRYVSSVLCLQYPYAVLRNLIDDFERVGVDIYSLLQSARAGQQVRNFLSLLNSEFEYNRLLGAASGYDLLRLRLEETKNIFESGATLLRRLQRHKKNTEWHVQRLYRMRNEIVHLGASPVHVDRTAPHLSRYLHAVLNEVVFRIQRHRLQSIPHILALIDDSYQALEFALSRTDEVDYSVISERVFLA